ncbi:hypothetical protein CBM2623_B30125 [Cupriavidus taiwanensis]|nr:hypothetical protein CBM2608_B30126 [Cupriavidus taiwanensis]SPA34478.1 hypothetical protein CBM2623_B30125 [Cupriavidus taiwanensis]
MHPGMRPLAGLPYYLPIHPDRRRLSIPAGPDLIVKRFSDCRPRAVPWKRADVNEDIPAIGGGADKAEAAITIPGFEGAGESHRRIYKKSLTRPKRPFQASFRRASSAPRPEM